MFLNRMNEISIEQFTAILHSSLICLVKNTLIYYNFVHHLNCTKYLFSKLSLVENHSYNIYGLCENKNNNEYIALRYNILLMTTKLVSILPLRLLN